MHFRNSLLSLAAATDFVHSLTSERKFCSKTVLIYIFKQDLVTEGAREEISALQANSEKKQTYCTFWVELTYGWFLVSIIKMKAELLKEEKKILFLTQSVWFCNLRRDPAVRVRSGSAATELLSFLFDRTLKNGLKKQVHLLQEAIKKKKRK